jgi:putative NADH-flavin reductase
MRVTVFGASGKIGRLVVEDLLADGHYVTAYLRDPCKLTISHPHLTAIEGQLSDPGRIRQSVRGADAVISALGPSLKRGAMGHPVTEGTQNIVSAMVAEGVRRYIGLATPSIADPRDQSTLKAKVLPVVARLAFPNALDEITGMTEAVAQSGLDWTIARITNPTDKPSKGTLRIGYLGHDKVGMAMSRADIAAFLTAQLDDVSYLKAMPAISN